MLPYATTGYVDKAIEEGSSKVVANPEVTGEETSLTSISIDDTKYIIEGGSGGGAVDSVNGQTGTVVLDKSDIGLGNVDNTSDANKPVSTAMQTALNDKQATLVSGTNIKTINNTSLLGEGNISLPVAEFMGAFSPFIWFKGGNNDEAIYAQGGGQDTSVYISFGIELNTSELEEYVEEYLDQKKPDPSYDAQWSAFPKIEYVDDNGTIKVSTQFDKFIISNSGSTVSLETQGDVNGSQITTNTDYLDLFAMYLPIVVFFINSSECAPSDISFGGILRVPAEIIQRLGTTGQV